MNDAEEQLRREVALFRYGLIADLIHLPTRHARDRRKVACQGRAAVHHSGTLPHPRGRGDSARLAAALPEPLLLPLCRPVPPG